MHLVFLVILQACCRLQADCFIILSVSQNGFLSMEIKVLVKYLHEVYSTKLSVSSSKKLMSFTGYIDRISQTAVIYPTSLFSTLMNCELTKVDPDIQ